MRFGEILMLHYIIKQTKLKNGRWTYATGQKVAS